MVVCPRGITKALVQLDVLTENGENDDGSEYCSRTVNETAHDCVSEAVVVHRVVRRERNQSTERQAHREEDLSACVQPHSGVKQLLELTTL